MAVLLSTSGFSGRRRRSTRHLHPLLLENDTKQTTTRKTKVNTVNKIAKTSSSTTSRRRRRSARLTGYESPPLSAASSPESINQMDKDSEEEKQQEDLGTKIFKEELSENQQLLDQKEEQLMSRGQTRKRTKRRVAHVANRIVDSVPELTSSPQHNDTPLIVTPQNEEVSESEIMKDQEEAKSNPLEENVDYVTLCSTLSLLYNQRDKIKNDIRRLNKLKKQFSDNPIELLNWLNDRKDNKDLLPARNKIIKCPVINLSKYGILDNEDSYISSAVNSYPMFQTSGLLK